jgi:hypothetical protein
MGSSSQSNISDTFRTSEEITQLIPYVSAVGGWFFDNAYRLIMGASNQKGKFSIDDGIFYIVNRCAIKEE